MKSLQGKKALVLGIASNRSIAWGISDSLKRNGAELAFTYQNDKLKGRVEKLANECDSDIIMPCDVSIDGSINNMLDQLSSRWSEFDIIIHSLAFAPREELEGNYVDSTLGTDKLDYIVMERGSYNNNRWSKGNCWYHRDTLLQVTGSNSITTIISEIFKKWDSSSREITVTAGSFETGAVYTIKTVGTTDFTLIGSTDNNIGTTFTATGPGVGTGEATTDSLLVLVNGTPINIQLQNGWTTGNDSIDQPKTKDIAPKFYSDDVQGFDSDKWDSELVELDFEFEFELDPVSYTHLTLPTTPYV